MHIPTLVRHPFSEGRPAKNRRLIFFCWESESQKKTHRKNRPMLEDVCNLFFQKIQVSNVQNPFDIPLYWLVNGGLDNGLL